MYVALQAGFDAFASQINANQSFNSASEACVTYVDVAFVALVVVAERDHRFPDPPLHSGGALENGVGAPLVLHTRRKYGSLFESVPIPVIERSEPAFVGVLVEDSVDS